MADRYTSSATKKSFLLLFTMASMLFVLSWFYVLRSADRPLFLDRNLLPYPRLNSVTDNGGSKPSRESNLEPSTGNRGIHSSTVRVLEGEGKKVSDVNCNGNGRGPLRVYMYDLDPEFHFGLLGWKPEGENVWPDIRTNIPRYPGGLNLQHSIEYWLTLDLLASDFAVNPNSRAGIRVRNSSESDVIFVPFFSSLSYNRFSKVNPHEKKSRDRTLQDKLVKFVTSQKEWKMSGGRDHVVLAHHPNSMLSARMKLWPSMYILSDFGRYPPNIANVEKDVIAPYKHVIKSYINDASTFDSRPTLLYFQGAIYRKDGGLARQELFYMLKDEKDVHFSFGSVKKNGVNNASAGMHSSKFCLNIAGDTPSSNRLFDAIASHCVPVIISDEIELPFEDVLDYSEFCVFVRTSDAMKEGFLLNHIRSIKKDEWTRMWHKLQEVEHYYEYHFPSKEGDAIQMIWQAVARKVPGIRMKINKANRYFGSVSVKESGLKTIPSPRNFQ